MYITTILMILSLAIISYIPWINRKANDYPLVIAGIIGLLVCVDLLFANIFWQTIGITSYAIFMVVLFIYLAIRKRTGRISRLGHKAFYVATSIFLVLTLLCTFLYPVSHYSGNGFTNIGVKKYTVINKYRLNPNDADQSRRYVLSLYYPTEVSLTRSDRYGFDGKTILRYLNDKQMGGMFINHIPQMRSVAKRDTDIKEGKYPVVVISPEQNMLVSFYEKYIQRLVNEGYIVAFIEHPYISYYTMFNDGTDASYSVDGIDHEIVMSTMTDDIVDAIDVIENLSRGVGDDFFQGTIKFDGMVALGHGLGGAAIINASFDDKRIKQVVVLDPDIEPISPNYYSTEFNKPLLVISSKKGYNQSMTRLSKLMRHLTVWGEHYRQNTTGNEEEWSFTNQGSFVKSSNIVDETIDLLLDYFTDKDHIDINENKTFELEYKR